MLPRKVFHSKPGSGSNLRSEVINTSSSSSSSASQSWMIQELCTERILDTARSGSAASRRELEIPQSVKVSRQVTSRLLRNIRFLSKARKNLDKLQLTRQSVENVGHVHVTKVVFHLLHFHLILFNQKSRAFVGENTELFEILIYLIEMDLAV